MRNPDAPVIMRLAESDSETSKSRLSALLSSVPCLAMCVFLTGCAVMMMYRPMSQMEQRDPSVYDYIAQSILRGQLPYRDVVDIKGPGSHYLGALTMYAGRIAGISDVLSVRFMQVLLVGLLCALIFVISERLMQDRGAAILAALVPVMPSGFAMMMIAGIQPKLPMIILGMLVILMIMDDRPFLAGLFSMIACLFWQVSLLFLGVAFLAFTRYLTKWRMNTLLKLALGAVLPLIPVLVYFKAKGIIGDMWAWTVTYNYTVFAPMARRALPDSIEQIWKISHRLFRSDLVVVILSLAGALWYGLSSLRTRLKGIREMRSQDVSSDAMVIAPLVYLLFVLENFQAEPDLILFLPFVGFFSSWLLLKCTRSLLKGRSVRVAGKPLSTERAVIISAVVAVSGIILVRGAFYQLTPGHTLQDQYRAVSGLSEVLGKDDRIFVHGPTEVLVLLNRPNLNPYVLMDYGADGFEASRKPGGIERILADMENEAPKVVIVSRLGTLTYRNQIQQWIQSHYDRLDIPWYDTRENLYVRRGQGPATAPENRDNRSEDRE